MPPKSKKRNQRIQSILTGSTVKLRKVSCLADLMDGHLSLDANVVTAETAFLVYKGRRQEAFADVGFEQFKLRLKDHRNQVKKPSMLRNGMKLPSSTTDYSWNLKELTTIAMSQSLIDRQPRNFFDRMSRIGNMTGCLQ
jgi:hypothetical protein